MSNNLPEPSKTSRQAEAGFTLIEATVAIMVLMIGLLGMAGAISYSVAQGTYSRNVTDSKMMIVAVEEQLETVKISKKLTYGQIANVGQVDNQGVPPGQEFGGFLNGFQPVMADPGPDNLFGTADDVASSARPGYQRQIVITPLSSSLKKIEITLRYPGLRGQTSEIKGVKYLQNDQRANFRR
jgi:type II secretory pathway pseudopilin PulG